MTSDPESSLFDFAASNRAATNEEEKTVTDIHAALGTTGVPLRLRRPPVLTTAPPWRNYMYAAATIALALAIAFGGYFTTRQDSPPSPTDVPEVVLGLAGQDSTATASETCELGASIPVIKGVETSPVDGAALLLTPSGDLILDCAGEQDILATGIEQVQPQSWPGIVSTFDGETSTYLNIATGDSYESEDLTHINRQRSIGPITARSTTQLIIVPATGSPTDAAILDLATLEEEQLFDSNSNPIPIANIPATTSNERGDCIVLAYSVHNTRMNSDYLGGFVVFDADGETQNVNSLDLQMPVPREIATSPDCDQIASASFQGQQMEGTTTFTIQHINGNNSIVLPMETGDLLTEMLWLKSGEGIIFGAGENLMLWEAPFDSSEPITLHEGIVFDDISLTRDPDIVTAIGMSYGGGPDSVPQRTLIVDTSNQDVTELKGNYVLRQRRLQPQEHNVLLVQDSQGHAYDAVSGEPLGQMDGDVEMSQSFIQVPIQPLSSAQLGIVGTAPDDMWRILDSDGQPIFEKIDLPPDSQLQGHPMISMSHDGWVFISQGWDWQTGWMKDLDDPDAEWLEITFTGDVNTVDFLNTEGLTMNASGTPQSSPIASATCDLSGDIPFIAGLDESPVDEPTVLHTMDRSLVVDCNGVQTSLLEDVRVATPTHTPHVIHAITDEGDYFINIVTEQQLFIPDPADTSTSQIYMQPWGPWAVMRSSTDGTKASVYNLETMTETPIITHARVHLGIDEAASLQMHSDDERFVLAYTQESVPGSRYLNGFFIVEANGESKLVAIGLEAEPRELAVSPDGQLIATAAFQGSRGEGTTTITLFAPEDDTIVAQYELQTIDQHAEITWQHDGSGLLLRDTFNLYRIDAEHPGDGMEIIAEGQNLQDLVLTPDNDVVAINHAVHSQSSPELKTLIVHIPTGKVIEVDGHDLWANPYITSTRTTLVLEDSTTAQVPRRGQARTLTVVNAVTGETLGEIEFEPLEGTAFNNSSYGVGNGDITVMAFRPDSMWKIVDAQGNATLEQIAPPPIDGDATVEALTIVTSQDGHLSLRIHEDQMQFTAWLLEPGSEEWIQLDLPSLEEMLPVIGFLRGDD